MTNNPTPYLTKTARQHLIRTSVYIVKFLYHPMNILLIQISCCSNTPFIWFQRIVGLETWHCRPYNLEIKLILQGNFAQFQYHLILLSEQLTYTNIIIITTSNKFGATKFKVKLEQDLQEGQLLFSFSNKLLKERMYYLYYY